MNLDQYINTKNTNHNIFTIRSSDAHDILSPLNPHDEPTPGDYNLQLDWLNQIKHGGFDMLRRCLFNHAVTQSFMF